jgi:hypothetical protein
VHHVTAWLSFDRASLPDPVEFVHAWFRDGVPVVVQGSQGVVTAEQMVHGRIRRFHQPYSADSFAAFLTKVDDTIDHAETSGTGGFVTYRVSSRDRDYAQLTYTVAEPRLREPAFTHLLLDLVQSMVRRVEPLYGQIGYQRHTETALIRQHPTLQPPYAVAEAHAQPVLGYDWVTMVPDAVGVALGGEPALRDSGAFAAVTRLDRGGWFLVSTPSLFQYDMAAAERVFAALAPSLPTGTPIPYETSLIDPPTHVVLRDAASG